ncbi:hypothetical protein H9P43_004734 [Blastocladiella emersonii ATCC 22665]|nr:hypothetical protein H9P43_004734 [Blastocladiella emersonii ATCC 22665]
MSLRLAPSTADAKATHTLANAHAEYGIHDTFRHGMHAVKHEVSPHHPLEPVLHQADDLYFKRNITMHRTVYGLHAPLRLQMERSLVSLKPSQLLFASRNLALEVLTGKDETIDVEDVLGDRDFVEDIDFHAAMERKLNIKI